MIRYILTQMRRANLFLVLVALLSMRSVSFSQLQVDVSYAPINSLSIGDVDFKTFGSNNWFFTLNITYPGTHPHMQLTGRIDISLADGTEINNPAATLVSTPFEVDNQRTVTNLDIGKNSAIKTESFDFNQDAKDKIQKLALGTGKLPAGSYTFTLTVNDQDAAVVPPVTKVISLNLVNVSSMSLISPQDMSETPTAFPLFQWRYDGTDVQISVYQKQNASQSKEDAATGVPQLQIQTGTAGFLSGSNSFQYPTVGARPLEAGKTYVWKVIGLTNGTGGVGQQIPSELWEFTVLDPNNPQHDTSGSGAPDFLTLLGEQLLGQLSGGNLSPTGLVYIDGQLVSAADVAAILADLKANPDKIIEITIVQ